MSHLWSVGFGIYWFASRRNRKQFLVFFVNKEEFKKKNKKKHFSEYEMIHMLRKNANKYRKVVKKSKQHQTQHLTQK